MKIEHADGLGRTGRYQAVYWRTYGGRVWTQAHLVAEEANGWALATKSLCGRPIDDNICYPAEQPSCKQCMEIAAKRDP